MFYLMYSKKDPVENKGSKSSAIKSGGEIFFNYIIF